jgi:hypothetical protein
MWRLFSSYGWLDLAPLRNQSTNFANPGLAGYRKRHSGS